MLRVTEDNLVMYGNVFIGEVYQEVDGFWVFAPKEMGAFTGYQLCDLGRMLNDMNRPWAEQILADLGGYGD